jgi:flagellar FliL protein
MSKKVIIIIIAIAVVFLAIIGGGFFFMWKMMSATLQQNQPATEEAVTAEDKANEIKPLYSLDTFIVNLADQGGKRYLRVTMELEISGIEVTEEINRRLPQIRNSILMIIPSKTYEDIGTAKGKAALRDELIAQLNTFLASGQITNIYFTEFVVQ